MTLHALASPHSYMYRRHLNYYEMPISITDYNLEILM